MKKNITQDKPLIPKDYYRVMSVKKNKEGDIEQLLCFKTLGGVSIKALSFCIISKDEVINLINKDKANFKVYYYNFEKHKYLIGPIVNVVADFLRTPKNKYKEDNLDNLPQF